MSNYTVKPCNFQLDNQSFIHCYFLLVLMPEPVLYIWLRCQFCIRYSLLAFRQSPRQISNTTSYIFNSTFEFLFTVQWSLVETKEAFVGVGDGDLSTSSLISFVHHAFWKRESVGNRRLLPQAKLLLALLKRSGPSVTKHYRKSSHSWTKKIFELKALCFNRASSILTWGESRVLLNERAGGGGR